jgi:hypothetical protein
MHENLRDIYKIQGEVQQEGSTPQYNSLGRKLQPSWWIPKKRKRRRYGLRSRSDHLL